MKILAFDITGFACSIALGEIKAGTVEVRASFHKHMQIGQAHVLMPEIEKLMKETSTQFSELDGIVVTKGPGSFTGIRAGLAAAKGLGIAHKTPILALSNFDVYASISGRDTKNLGEPLLVALETKRQDLYLQLFDGDLNPLWGEKDNLDIDLKYASTDNFTGEIVYTHAIPYIHADAYPKLILAQTQAKALGYQLKIFDAFRPTEAQEILWDHCPDETFITPPKIGSPHSRGVAVDLTLVDTAGNELEMGTPFDDFTPHSYHGCKEISVEAQKNRLILCGIMALAGWEHFSSEWWHYHLPNRTSYPLINDNQLPEKMMSCV